MIPTISVGIGMFIKYNLAELEVEKILPEFSYPVLASKIKSIKISYEEDFQLAEYILKTINAPQQPPKYYSEQ